MRNANVVEKLQKLSLLSWQTFIIWRIEGYLVCKLKRESIINVCKELVDFKDESSNPKD